MIGKCSADDTTDRVGNSDYWQQETGRFLIDSGILSTRSPWRKRQLKCHSRKKKNKKRRRCVVLQKHKGHKEAQEGDKTREAQQVEGGRFE